MSQRHRVRDGGAAGHPARPSEPPCAAAGWHLSTARPAGSHGNSSQLLAPQGLAAKRARHGLRATRPGGKWIREATAPPIHSVAGAARRAGGGLVCCPAGCGPPGGLLFGGCRGSRGEVHGVWRRERVWRWSFFSSLAHARADLAEEGEVGRREEGERWCMGERSCLRE